MSTLCQAPYMCCWVCSDKLNRCLPVVRFSILWDLTHISQIASIYSVFTSIVECVVIIEIFLIVSILFSIDFPPFWSRTQSRSHTTLSPQDTVVSRTGDGCPVFLWLFLHRYFWEYKSIALQITSRFNLWNMDVWSQRFQTCTMLDMHQSHLGSWWE